VWQYRKLVTEHAFDKLRAIDCTFAEFAEALEESEVIEQEQLVSDQSKEVLLVTNWSRPLHVVVVVDRRAEEERIVTVYEPDPQGWSADYRRRR
jgi:hypothetical protein